MPSRATLKWLAATGMLASLVCFAIFSADYNCGAQSWNCATLAGIAMASVIAGLALGLLLTAGVVLLGWCYVLACPAGRAPEGSSSAARVAINLVAAQVLVFGVMQLLGTLPIGWVWWLGAFGAVGMHPAGSVYVVPAR